MTPFDEHLPFVEMQQSTTLHAWRSNWGDAPQIHRQTHEKASLALFNRRATIAVIGTSHHQRGAVSMRQGVLPFQYVGERKGEGMTAFAGLGLYLDLLHAARLPALADHETSVRDGQGYRDGQMLTALVLLNLAGGDGVRDVEALEQDDGLCALMRKAERCGLGWKGQRAEQGRWRKARTRTFPSQSAIFRYLEAFHDEAQEECRAKVGTPLAFIPAANAALRGLRRLNQHFVAWVQSVHPEGTATVDMDATLIETGKQEALYGYKGHKAYQPLQVYWAEQGLLVESEFRDGNVPAGHEQLRLFQESLAVLPQGVKNAFLRSDTAGYQQELLLYCGEGKDRRFGVIPFAVGADMTAALRGAVGETPKEDWHPLEDSTTGQEWAEVCYVPNWVGHTQREGTYRYVAVREPVRQSILPGMERQLPFEALTMEDGRAYKVTAVVTNRHLPGAGLLRWYRGRCGKSEEVHSVLKSDLAGGRMPSGSFGENAAWWAVAVLSANLHAAAKRLALGEEWAQKRLKAVRYGLITIAGRVVEHGRQMFIQVRALHPGFATLVGGRGSLLALTASPPG